jgi:hypothetical protein
VAFLLLIPFAFFLEYLNIRLHHQYAYSDQLFMLGPAPYGVPLAVCVSWASMIFIAMRTSDLWGLDWKWRPWTDGLVAVSIDLVGDPVSSTTRIVENFDGPCQLVPPQAGEGMGIWTWCVTADEATWFGVPWDNYFGWFVVVLLVSYVLRAVGRAAKGVALASSMVRLGLGLGVAFVAVFGAIQLYLRGPFGHPLASAGVVIVLLAVGLGALARHLQHVPHHRFDFGLVSLALLSIVTGLGYYFTQGPGVSAPLPAAVFTGAATGSLFLLSWPYRPRSWGGAS